MPLDKWGRIRSRAPWRPLGDFDLINSKCFFQSNGLALPSETNNRHVGITAPITIKRIGARRAERRTIDNVGTKVEMIYQYRCSNCTEQFKSSRLLPDEPRYCGKCQSRYM